MVKASLLEQLERLSPAELVEFRDVIEAKLGDGVSAGQWATLEQRVAEADANPDDYITLDEWKARRISVMQSAPDSARSAGRRSGHAERVK